MPRVSPDYEQAQKKRIIEGATAVFAKYGYRQTTIDQICHALQLSKGAVYSYFKSKEELYVSIQRSIFEQRYMLLSSAYAPDDPFTLKVEKIMARLGSLATHDDDVYTRLSVEGFLESGRIPGLQPVKTDFYNRSYMLLYDLFVQGKAAEQINPDLDISSMVAVLMATLDGLMMHSLVQERGIDQERIREIVFKTFSQVLNIDLKILE